MGRPSKDPVFETGYQGRTYQAIERDVTATGNGARVYLPLEWAGKKVICILLD